MNLPARSFLLIAVTAGAFVIAWIAPGKGPITSPQARWFVPGYWGSEPGRRPDAPGKEAWLTRSISGGDKVWEDQNHLGPRMSFSHNLGNIVRFEDYPAHPEWFPLEKGKRVKPASVMLNWQPDLGSEAVVEHAAEFAERELQGSTESPRAVALGINDTVFFGESPEAMRWVTPLSYFRGRPNYSDLVFSFMNRVAARVEEQQNQSEPASSARKNSPLSAPSYLQLKPYNQQLPLPSDDWRLGCLAYYWCEQVPSFQLHPRIVPFLCADRAQGYDSAFWKEEMDLQERWGKAFDIGRSQKPEARGQNSENIRANSQEPVADRGHSQDRPRIGIYDYLDGFGFLIPRVHTQLLVKHLRHAKQAGFTDYYGEASPNWGLDGPQMWLVSQLLAHPDADAKALLDEYYTRFFAEASAPMRRFFDRCEELWMAQPGPAKWLKYYRNESQAGLFQSTECRRLRAILTEALKAAKQEKVQKRVQLVSDAFGLTERFVEYVEAKSTLSTLNASGLQSGNQNAAPASTQAAIQRCLTARSELEQYLADLRRSQPLAIFNRDLNDFNWLEPVYAAVLDTGSDFSTDNLGSRAAMLRSKSQNIETCNLLAGSFEGPVIPGRKVGGLQYGADLPSGWLSKLEPTEGMIASTLPEAARSGTAGLRLANQVYASVYQWLPIDPKSKGYEVEAWYRGKLSKSARVSLYLAWVDDKGQIMENMKYGVKFEPETLGPEIAGRKPEFRSPQLTDEKSPDWTQLRTGTLVPAKAKWVGVVILANFMVPNDWVDVDDVILRRY